MASELNPLRAYKSYEIKHVLIAFQYSEDAYRTTLSASHNYVSTSVNITLGGSLIGDSPVGTIFSGPSCGGGAIIVMNEFADEMVKLTYAESIWSFFSPTHPKTSSYVGAIQFTDRSGLLFAEKLKKYSDILGTSLHHITFAWFTVFIGIKNNDTKKYVTNINPLYFHVTKFSQNISSEVGKTYLMEFVSSYNTHAIGPQFANLSQLTITNKDSNIINTIPLPVASSTGIVSTRKEDSLKLNQRTTRLQKTKYMKTIGDAISGLELSLDNQKFSHKKQLQIFNSLIRNNYTDKLNGVVQAMGDLPMTYSLDLDPYYKNHKINNRNLPFEQYECDQSISGISSLTLPANASIHTAIDLIMRLSTDVADDYTITQPTSYKITSVTSRTCDNKYKIFTKIRKYSVAFNSVTSDSGPGDGVINNTDYFNNKSNDFVTSLSKNGNIDFDDPFEQTSSVLEFEYQNIKALQKSDVIAMSYATFPEYKLVPMESNNTSPDAQAVYGDRELTTMERNGNKEDFFDRGITGLRTTTGLHIANGLENSSKLANIINLINKEPQQTNYILKIDGNPHLLNDINRNPLDVMSDTKINGISNYIIYSNVETDPMYLKLTLHMTGDSNLGSIGRPSPLTDGIFYYNGYLHMHKVTNMFAGGSFIQYLSCARTDESV